MIAGVSRLKSETETENLWTPRVGDALPSRAQGHWKFAPGAKELPTKPQATRRICCSVYLLSLCTPPELHVETS